MISSLDRKLLRDIWHVRGQALAIAAVIACGIAIFVTTRSASESLEVCQRTYYDRYGFADVFASLKRAPLSLQHRLAEIPGVAALSPRIVKDVTLSLKTLKEPATARLVSMSSRTDEGLNRIHLRKGRMLEPSDVDNVLVNEAFANAWSMEPGDSVTVIMNGRLRRLYIVGVALSPEYVYLIRPGDLIPDPSRFAIFWMNRKAIEAAFDMEGAFNDVAVQLMPNANVEEVIRQIDVLTQQYGGLGAFARRDQMSNRFLSDEIENLRSVGTVIPLIFLLVSAFLLNLVVGRIIGTQREQIAALKALGYFNWSIGWHYMKFSLMIVGLGWLIGVLGGAYIGRNLTLMYTQFFSFPFLTYHLTLRIITTAAGIAIVAGIVGTAGAVRRAVALPPAEAMRPEPPARYQPTVLERMGMAKLFSNTTLMVLRHIERTPVKSGMSILGIAMAVGVLVLGRSTADGVMYMVDIVFTIQQRQDLTITFIEPRSIKALYEIRSIEGVLDAEPFRSVPARLRFGHHSRRTGVMGLQDDASLYELIDQRIKRIDLPKGGIMLSEKMAQMIGARPGDTVTLEVLEGSRPKRDVVITGLAREFLGTTPYMEIEALNQVMEEGSVISGVHVQADAKNVDHVYETLKNMPRVAGVTIKNNALVNFRKTMAETLLIMVMFQTAFATVIAFGVVYNAARLAVAERSRELASLRVLGFTRAEISVILLGELAILVVVAIPVGLILGHIAAYFIVQSFDTELFRIPFHLESATYARAVLVVAFAALVSALIVRRKLDQLDLIAVLKTKE